MSEHVRVERCGYTIDRGGHNLLVQYGIVRVAQGDWATYLPVEFYDEFEGDDVAFASIMDARREEAVRERAAMAVLEEEGSETAWTW